MKRLLPVLAALALVVPTAALAASAGPNDGTFVVKNGDGVMWVKVTGGLLGTCDSCHVAINDPNPDDGPGAVVTGEEHAKDVSDTKSVYSGNGVHFRMVGGTFLVKIWGSNVNLYVTGTGNGWIRGYASNTGTYTLNDGPKRDLPDLARTFSLGS